MDRYTKYQIVASICVALFITSTAMFILANTNTIYNRCYENYYAELREELPSVPSQIKRPAEASLYFTQLSDSFAKFFGKNYEISGYELTKENTKHLNDIKTYYRLSVVISIFSFIAGCYSIWFISKRRMYMPLVYGGLLAALFTSVNSLILIFGKNEVVMGVRNMIFDMDYSFFSEGDLLLSLFPPEYARWLFGAYIILVLILILIMVFLRQLIVFLGRPHKF